MGWRITRCKRPRGRTRTRTACWGRRVTRRRVCAGSGGAGREAGASGGGCTPTVALRPAFAPRFERKTVRVQRWPRRAGTTTANTAKPCATPALVATPPPSGSASAPRALLRTAPPWREAPPPHRGAEGPWWLMTRKVLPMRWMGQRGTTRTRTACRGLTREPRVHRSIRATSWTGSSVGDVRVDRRRQQLVH